MKCVKTLLKLAAAAAAIAGIAYLVVKYMDTITAWLGKLCPACKYKAEAEAAMNKEDFAVPPVVETATEEAAAEEAPVEEAAETEAPIAEGDPVAEESDFEA